MDPLVELRLLAAMPEGPIFDARIPLISTQMIAVSLDAANLVAKMSTDELVRRHRRSNWQDASTLASLTRNPDFLAHLWDKDRRKSVRVEVARNTAVPDRVLLGALEQSVGDHDLRNAIGSSQPAARVANLAANERTLGSLVLQLVTSSRMFAHQWLAHVDTTPLEAWPGLLGTGQAGARLLIVYLEARGEQVSPEQAVRLAELWQDVEESPVRHELRAALALRMADLPTGSTELLTRYPWPELVDVLLWRRTHTIRLADLAPAFDAEGFRRDDVLRRLVSSGAPVDGDVVAWLVEDPLRLRWGLPMAGDPCSQITDDGVARLCELQPWKGLASPDAAAPAAGYLGRLLDWVLAVATTDQLARILTGAIDPFTLKAALPHASTGSARLSRLSPSDGAALLASVSDPVALASLAKAVTPEWTADDWRRSGMLVSVVTADPTSDLLVSPRVPIGQTEARIMIDRVPSENRVASVLSCLPLWVTPEGREPELVQLALAACEDAFDDSEATTPGLHSRLTSGSITPLWRDCIGAVDLAWLHKHTPKSLEHLRAYIGAVATARRGAAEGGSLLAALVPGLELPWGRVTATSVLAAATGYLSGELRDSREWDSAWSLLPQWEGTLVDLVHAARSL